YFNDEFHCAYMNNPYDEIGIGEVESEGEGEAQAEGSDLESKFSPTPIVGNNNPCDCNWWLRDVKFTSSERFSIRIYEKYHTCGSDHLTRHNLYAMTKVIGKYFENRFPNVRAHPQKTCQINAAQNWVVR
ncbi:hypothetical protein EJD97_011381, partial [Solanum chilense]